MGLLSHPCYFSSSSCQTWFYSQDDFSILGLKYIIFAYLHLKRWSCGQNPLQNPLNEQCMLWIGWNQSSTSTLVSSGKCLKNSLHKSFLFLCFQSFSLNAFPPCLLACLVPLPFNSVLAIPPPWPSQCDYGSLTVLLMNKFPLLEKWRCFDVCVLSVKNFKMSY